MPLTIELSQDYQGFRVELPSGHHIELPATLEGALLLRNLLVSQKRREVSEAMARVQAMQQDQDKRLLDALVMSVGTDPSPAQHDVNRALRAIRANPGLDITQLPARGWGSRKLKRKTESDFNLEDIGL